ncbi:hypothetical protein M0P65_02225 [Candidatus Gracilibacteria bacterium]|nr:hypothetical protein [Candidatus Gracilibacteria bacterium]
MSNRLTAMLILTIIFGGIFGIYYYFFVANVASITFDVGSFTGVTIKMESEYKKYDIICDQKCSLGNVPPFSYFISANITGYKDISLSTTLQRGENKAIKLTFEKLVYIEEIKTPSEEKIALLKFKQINSSSGSTDLEDKKTIIGVKGTQVFYYSYDPDFSVYSEEKGIIKPILNIEGKKIDEVIFNKNDLLLVIKSGNFNYLYDLTNNMNYSLNIDDKIIYPKKANFDGKYLINTIVGTYLYDVSNNTKTKNTIFNDYIVVSEGKIIGLINQKDKEKLNILNFGERKGDILVLNNIDTRDRKIIYETENNIKYLEFVDSNVILTTEDGTTFELKELEF